MAFKWFAVCLLHLLLCACVSLEVQAEAEAGELTVGYYKKSCPRAEPTIKNMVAQRFNFAASLLRLHFHDCFVRGCDASVLLDGNGVEKEAVPNLLLRGFQVIDEIKRALEDICPKTVSCADILTFVARDSAVLIGAEPWSVAAGRKDGLVSRAEDVLQNIPLPSFDVPKLTQNFVEHGLSQEEMVTLSGAHTIGVSHCNSFIGRLYNANEGLPMDPLDPRYGRLLRRVCPRLNFSNQTVFPLDTQSPCRFNNDYYTNLKHHKGLLFSDQVLYEDDSTNNLVVGFSKNSSLFLSKFKDAMIRMGSIGVLTSDEGEVRRNCRCTNAPTSP